MLLDHFDRPWCLWLLLLTVVLWWMARRSLAGLGPIRGRLALLIRGAVLLLLVLAMAGAHKIQKNDDLTVIFVLDQSRSIPPDLRQRSLAFIRAATQHMKPDDRAAILTFDGQTNIEQLPSRPGPEGGIHVPTPFADGQRPDQTNIAQALRVAAACALDSTNNRIVLLTDGNQNVGDALSEAKSVRTSKIALDILPLRYEAGAEVVFEELRAPAYANVHERIPLRLTIRSDKETSGTIVVYQRVGQEEKLIDISGETEDEGGARRDPGTGESGSDSRSESGPRSALPRGRRVVLHPGRNAFTVRLPINTPRSHEFRAEFIPDDKSADAVAQNNVARAFTNVEGPQTVLFVGSQLDRPDDQLLIDALTGEKINVQIENAESVNLDTTVLQDFAAIILANVGADLFSQDQQRALATYVRDLGGGLIMLGGDDSFGAGGWQGSVVEDIMPVKFDVDAIKQIPRGALAIVMHSCEMPQGNKWGIETAVAALKVLSSLDYFGVVSLGMGNFVWDVPMQPATNKEALIARIRRMQNSDMPDFDTPMRMACQALLDCKDASQRHMIVISDGDPSPPSSGLLNQCVGNRITVSTVSIFPHTGTEIATLKNIARITKGNYYHLSKPGDERRLPRIFTKEAKVVRRPLIRDERFAPVLRPHLSDIMAGVQMPLPELLGYVVTTPRKEADVEMPLVTKRGDPLLAHWLVGFGRTVAFTSGRWRHWGSEWASWSGFTKFWAQCVRWVMQQASAANYDVSTTIEGDKGRVVIESLSEGAGFADFEQFAGRLVQPDGDSTPLPIVQTGPGRYEGVFELRQQGTYLMQISAAGAGGKRTTIRTGLTLPYSPEFRDLSPNEALLRELKDEAGGRELAFDADPASVFAHDLPPVLSRKPIWDSLLKWVIFVFLLDVAVRRVAIDPVKVLAATTSYIRSLAGRFGAGQRAEAVLRGLKETRQKVREERTAEGDAAALRSAERASAARAPTETAPSSQAKFEAPADAKKPSRDLSEALGGHQPAAPAGEPTEPSPKPPVEPPESTTSRLLKARKRSKDQQ